MNPSCTARFRQASPLTVPVSAGAEKPWIHIVPGGEHPGTVSIPAGYEVPGYGTFDEAAEVEGLTVIGAAQLESMVQRFNGEMLIDYEHFSHDPDKKTEASGWGLEVRYAADRNNLELQTDWTPTATREIKEQIYRFISPEFAGSVTYEGGTFKFFPTRLTGAGLTNRPKLTALKPVSVNRDKPTPTPTTMDYKAILLSLLGLPATATDQEIEAKRGTAATDMAQSQNRASEITTLQTKVAKLEGDVIESDLTRFAPVIEDKESAKELLVLNRDKAVKFFEAQLAKVKPGETQKSKTPIYQKNRATPPGGLELDEDEDEADEAATAKFRSIEANAHRIARERKLPFAQAFEAAKAEAGS